MQEVEGNNVFWMYRQKSLIEADMKKYNVKIDDAVVRKNGQATRAAHHPHHYQPA